jgi:uncharacterized membrane protein YhaH (DUF805 family)
MAPMNWLYLFNGFHGRIGRQTFWLASGILILAELVAGFLAEQIQGDRLAAIVDLAFTYPEFAVAIKRLHDRNLPIWLLVFFFGGAALTDLFSLLGIGGGDDSPNVLLLAVEVPVAVLGLALLVELGFRRGTVGPNPNGPDPLSRT